MSVVKRGISAILRIVVRSTLSEVGVLALVKCLLKAWDLSNLKLIDFESTGLGACDSERWRSFR